MVDCVTHGRVGGVVWRCIVWAADDEIIFDCAIT